MTGKSNVHALHHRAPAGSSEPSDLSGHANLNPEGMSLLALVAEDFRTHGKNALDPGFLALAVHRFGNLRNAVKTRLLRAPLSASYEVMHTTVSWFWGIHLASSVKVGRRVRIWHHGGMWIRARSIGDDVVLRHNVTIGTAHRGDPEGKPIIEDRVDIGSGAAILGAVRVGADSVIGANSVVVRSFPASSTLFGVPARPVRLVSDSDKKDGDA
jgi:serine O-acetyltransferase